MAQTVRVQTLKGVTDILPGEVLSWEEIEQTAKEIFVRYGYAQVRTPVMEDRRLFVKSVGEGTDIVQKEMFAFTDRGGRDIVLRPEGTAPVVRAYIEHAIAAHNPFAKFFYIGPMFRAERPQAGRSRQFHQIGVEAIGSYSPYLDAEVIILLAEFIRAAGVTGAKIQLNSLGCDEDKKRLRERTAAAVDGNPAAFCPDCVKRATANALRVWDCKNPACQHAIRAIGDPGTFLCDGCRERFSALRKILDRFEIPYVIDPFIVRGLDYYTGTVFEVRHGALGAQDALAAGGRYDGLVASLGGPQTGACGFAIGVERLLIVRARLNTVAAQTAPDMVFFAALGEQARERAFALLQQLRSRGIAAQMDLEGRSLKAQMRVADRLGARVVLIIGENELARDEIVVRDMRTQQQMTIGCDRTAEEVVRLLGR